MISLFYSLAAHPFLTMLNRSYYQKIEIIIAKQVVMLIL